MIKNLRILTFVVAAMVVIEALLKPGLLLWLNVDHEGLLAFVGSDGSRIDSAMIGFFVLTAIVFSVWIYVAGKNLEATGLDLEFTPASRVWWFAVPVANLFKPFQGMRELRNASHGSPNYDENNGLVTGWWAVWLGGNFLTYVTDKMAGAEAGTGPLWIVSVLGIAQAGFAIPLIVAIARAQGQDLHGANLDEVFA